VGKAFVHRVDDRRTLNCLGDFKGVDDQIDNRRCFVVGLAPYPVFGVSVLGIAGACGSEGADGGFFWSRVESVFACSLKLFRRWFRAGMFFANGFATCGLFLSVLSHCVIPVIFAKRG